MNSNPLLKPYNTPLQSIPFDRIKQEHILPAVKSGIAKAQSEIDQITSNPEPPTFENTIVALENSGRDLERALNYFFPLLSAHSDDKLMELSHQIDPLLSEYSTSISLNENLWHRIKSVYDNTLTDAMSAEDRMLLNETYESFARGGALLEGESRSRYKSLVARLSELTTLFGQNILKELNTYKIYLTSSDLAGLPERLIEEASHAAESDGRPGEYLFTLAQPTYISFMKYSSRRDLREKMYRLYTGRNTAGEFSNIEIVKEIARLRSELAKLMGRETYAHYKLEHTMADEPGRVYDLLYSLRDAYIPALHDELSELSRFADETEKHHVKLQPWDYSYYANKLRESKYSYNEEELRPYFNLENVIDGVFGLAKRLYGLSFEHREDLPVYHEDVKAFEVKDSDGSYLGLIYTDFFPRETKRPGAWMTEFKSQWIDDNGVDSRPHVSIVMNFTKPTPTKPSLLTPYEVGTFLHEFGHALHGLLSRVHYSSLSGTNVRRDFVELPSQFNENYLTQKEFLDGFARHYVTGEPIPEELIDRIVSTSRFGAAYACIRQLNFGLLDMGWHSITEPVTDVAEFENKAIESVKIFEPVEGSLISPQFSHIFSGGYAAGYYSYKWAEVLDADAFAKFKDDGIFNTNTAHLFRECILEKGGTENPADLYKRFRGKEPSIDALLDRDGIR